MQERTDRGVGAKVVFHGSIQEQDDHARINDVPPWRNFHREGVIATIAQPTARYPLEAEKQNGRQNYEETHEEQHIRDFRLGVEFVSGPSNTELGEFHRNGLDLAGEISQKGHW
jgi:hypothetical protein